MLQGKIWMGVNILIFTPPSLSLDINTNINQFAQAQKDSCSLRYIKWIELAIYINLMFQKAGNLW